MITIDDFKNFVAKNPGATTSEIQKQLKLSRGRIHKISSSNPDSIKVVKDGRNSKHSINPEQLVFNEVSIVIDNSFPTKQLSIRQFDVTNTTPKAITDFRAFSCDDHEIFKKNIGPIYLNDKKSSFFIIILIL